MRILLLLLIVLLPNCMSGINLATGRMAMGGTGANIGVFTGDVIFARGTAGRVGSRIISAVDFLPSLAVDLVTLPITGPITIYNVISLKNWLIEDLESEVNYLEGKIKNLEQELEKHKQKPKSE